MSSSRQARAQGGQSARGEARAQASGAGLREVAHELLPLEQAVGDELLGPHGHGGVRHERRAGGGLTSPQHLGGSDRYQGST